GCAHSGCKTPGSVSEEAAPAECSVLAIRHGFSRGTASVHDVETPCSSAYELAPGARRPWNIEALRAGHAVLAVELTPGPGPRRAAPPAAMSRGFAWPRR